MDGDSLKEKIKDSQDIFNNNGLDSFRAMSQSQEF